MYFAGFLGLYLLSAGISLALFSFIRQDPGFAFNGDLADARSQISDAPKTQECPTNGDMFTKAEEAIWEQRRPLVAMIENHLDSRPQSGLSQADIIYEAVAEGGITRFASVFYCDAADKDVRIGPIRSARIYFINWASEYDSPLYLHAGGANNICGNCPGGVKEKGKVAKEVLALEELINLGWRHAKGNALDAGANVGFPEVWRDYERIPGAATEHTFMGSTDKLYEVGAERGFGYENADGEAWIENFRKWKFKDESPMANPKASRISFMFWNGMPNYDVTWEYDSASNSYKRYHGNQPHIDMDTDEQLTAKNIVIQFVEERGPVDEEKHMFYNVISKGDMILFQNGDVVTGTWEKTNQSARTIFYDNQGREIEFVRGVTWIEALPDGNKVDY